MSATVCLTKVSQFLNQLKQIGSPCYSKDPIFTNELTNPAYNESVIAPWSKNMLLYTAKIAK